MGGKYKKKLRSEKARVKLKKKPLPKGQNITDTSFKVRKIITVEQLKKVNENEPVSSWNVPLKDLLVHLSHHNKSSRLNALNGIKEVIINYPQVLTGPSLNSIVVKALEMMSDLELQVRSQALSLLQIVFSNLESTQIALYYDILNAHLACIMTHRQVAVQKDSLRLFDVIIEHASEAVKQNSKLLIHNLMRILCAHRHGSQSEVYLTRGSKKDLEESKVGIIHRLHQILNICYSKEIPENKLDYLTVNANESNACSLRMSSKQFKQLPDLSSLFKPRIINTSVFLSDNENYLQQLISQLIPLLFETWTELFPPQENNGFIVECILKENTATLLQEIMEIIVLLFEKGQRMKSREVETLLRSTHGPQFVKLFLSSFPFLPHTMRKNFNDSNSEINVDESNYDKSYLVQNLTACYLVYSLKLKVSQELEKKLDDYVLHSLLDRNTKGEDILSKIMEVLLLTSSRRKTTETFLETAIKAYKHTTNVDFQSKLLKILTDISLNDKFEHLHANKSLIGWYSYLTKGLYKDKISYQVVVTLSRVVSRVSGCEALVEIERRFTEIVKNLPKIKVEGCSTFQSKKCVANILFWCDNSTIGKFLESGVLEAADFPSDIKNYVLSIFTYKLSLNR